jgi:hypothetical protein
MIDETPGNWLFIATTAKLSAAPPNTHPSGPKRQEKRHRGKYIMPSWK